MRNGITREFDVRLRDEECDRANAISATQLNRIAEQEAAYSSLGQWEALMQAIADSIRSDNDTDDDKEEDDTPCEDDEDIDEDSDYA